MGQGGWGVWGRLGLGGLGLAGVGWGKADDSDLPSPADCSAARPYDLYDLYDLSHSCRIGRSASAPLAVAAET